MTASERLRELRTRAGFPSARQAAQAMGVALATYTQHENGQRAFTADQALDYAAFFIGLELVREREAQGLEPRSHDHLAATLHVVDWTSHGSPDRPRWADRTPEAKEPYRKAVDAVFRHLGVALPLERQEASSDQQRSG
jgi:transcriptional regulator with XRE-family HTH domain